MQHEELCKFPSNEFYDGKLKTDVSVSYRTDSETRLRIWPQGPKKPYVFVNVEGEESESHTGRKGKARVGLESKFNRDEAEKIVSCIIASCNSYIIIINVNILLHRQILPTYLYTGIM